MIEVVESELSPASILKGLGTSFVGQNILHYPTLPSTMDIARQIAKEGAAEGTILVAEEQTGGRGRGRREWVSPPGSLSLSILLHPAPVYLPRLFIVASLAVSHSIEAVTGLKTQIKWPNDILTRGKKVSGILIESELRGKGVDFAILGLGLNINFDPSAFPEISSTATTLSKELGEEVSPLMILQRLLREVERLYLAAKAGEPLHEEWRQRLETLGKTVRAKWGDTVEEGYAESVDPDGSLLLRRPDGSLARIVAGDVTLRD